MKRGFEEKAEIIAEVYRLVTGGEGVPLSQNRACARVGISVGTFDRWTKQLAKSGRAKRAALGIPTKGPAL